jgi:hypothetical protein
MNFINERAWVSKPLSDPRVRGWLSFSWLTVVALAVWLNIAHAAAMVVMAVHLRERREDMLIPSAVFAGKPVKPNMRICSCRCFCRVTVENIVPTGLMRPSFPVRPSLRFREFHTQRAA